MRLIAQHAQHAQHAEFAHDLTPQQLTMPVDELVAAARHKVRVLPNLDQLYSWLARIMADQIKANNDAGNPTRWILPVGPKAQYPLLAQICNEERISWRNVHAFHMDEFLDWQGRQIGPDHPFSFRGFCDRNLYERLAPELRPDPETVVYPDVRDPDAFASRLRDAGGADTCFAGFGYRGHLAFNEPPTTRWHHYTVEEFKASTTRIVPLLEDTIVAHSHRTTGGYTQTIPRMAITIGMSEILSARKLHLITDGGAWKQFIVRVLLLTSEPDVMYPVTLAHDHPDVEVTVDAASIAPLRPGINA